MSNTKFNVYKDKSGHFRWKLLSRNGESVCEGGEGYKDKRDVINAVKKLKVWANTVNIVDLTVPTKPSTKTKKK
ncbi:MAG: DUF1508 domain-containing protein [Minisyncoccia bacterium]